MILSLGDKCKGNYDPWNREAWHEQNPHLICRHFSPSPLSDATLCLHTHLAGCGSASPSDSVSLSKAALWQENPMNWWGGGGSGTPSRNSKQSSIYVPDRRNTHQPFLYFAFPKAFSSI